MHFELWGSGYPLQWTEELKFEGDRYITPSMLVQDAQKAEFRTIQRLVRGDCETLACNFRIKLLRESNFNLILLHHRRRREHIVIRVEQHALRLFGQADLELARSLISNQRYGPGTRDMPVEVEIDRHRHHEPL